VSPTAGWNIVANRKMSYPCWDPKSKLSRVLYSVYTNYTIMAPEMNMYV